MNPAEFWQNFQLGAEQEIAANFIYDGLRNLHEMDTLSMETEVFPVLYDLSVGLERLFKVVVVLLEFNQNTDVDALEKSLITHNHLELLKRVREKADINLGSAHTALLDLLTKFYKTHRYDRFTLQSVYDLSKDKKALHAFLHKHLQIDVTEDIFGLDNSLRVKRFIGRTVKKITKQLYAIVQNEAFAKNIYTYEISSSSSKAAKILWGNDDILFEDEDRAMVEIFMFLQKTKDSSLMDFTKSIKPLELDPALSSEYLQFILKRRTRSTSMIMEEIETLYEELDRPGDRQQMIDAIKNPDVDFEMLNQSVWGRFLRIIGFRPS